jgi:nitroreductase
MRTVLTVYASFLIWTGVGFCEDQAVSHSNAASMSVAVLDPEQAYVLDVIKTRRTVREFKPDPVPEAHIRAILDAARFAPTAGNQQPWKFLVIRDRRKLDRLEEEALGWYLERFGQTKQIDESELEKAREAVGASLHDVLSAPTYVAVLVDTEPMYPDYVIYDGALAAGYLMIAARALGYGTGFFTTFFPNDEMKAFLGIPDRYKLICFTPIGMPQEWPKTPPKKSLSEVVVWETFGD